MGCYKAPDDSDKCWLVGSSPMLSWFSNHTDVPDIPVSHDFYTPQEHTNPQNGFSRRVYGYTLAMEVLESSNPGIPVHSLFLNKPKYTGWWFRTFFIFPYLGNNHQNWVIFFRGVGIPTTNQYRFCEAFVLWVSAKVRSTLRSCAPCLCGAWRWADCPIQFLGWGQSILNNNYVIYVIPL